VLPTASSSNSISTPRDASWQETQSIAALETSKQTGSDIADSTKPKKPRYPPKNLYEPEQFKTQIIQLINLQCVSLLGFRCQLRAFLLRVHKLATRVSVESEKEGVGEKTISHILNLDCSNLNN